MPRSILRRLLLLAAVLLVIASVLPFVTAGGGPGGRPATVRVLYSGNTQGYLEACG